MERPTTIPEMKILGAVMCLEIQDAHPVPDVVGTVTPRHRKGRAGDRRALETILERAGYGSVGAVHPKSLDIEIGDLEGISFDKIPTRLDLVAHERREDQVGGHPVFDIDLQKSANRGIHGGLP